MSVTAVVALVAYATPLVALAVPAAAICTSVQRGNPYATSGHFILTSTMTFNCEGVGIKTIGQLSALGWKISHVYPTTLHGNTQIAYQLVIEHD
jgi:hypothetical protein